MAPSSDRNDTAESVVAAVGESAILVGDEVHRVTVTVGVASGSAADFATIYAAADRALYSAKASGRNTWARAT